ncbi:MAG TPA: GGDEF domain-containing protein [Candidatus Gastranaerophilaceae bacterium]|nr:GGDEF domain-containing protein [Candidatus Gastranaerophilaceae bacterium]
MKNIIIYSNQNKSALTEMLSSIEDSNVRVESDSLLKEYTLHNPSLVIVESAPNLKEVLMTTKFFAPILIVGPIFTDVTVRAEGFDFINTPVNKDELIVRVNALLKIKELKDTLSLATTTDELTGLHNRKYLHERLESEISRAKRYKTQLSCLLFDIDFFKVVNDMYGYDWGDVLLKSLADKLKFLVRKEDILTRYGDEEFLLVLPNTSEENAFLFAERFRRDIEKMEFIPAGEDERHPITISGGISTYPCLENVEEDANTIIRYAEHALYNAKKRGKNKIIQFSQINLDY